MVTFKKGSVVKALIDKEYYVYYDGGEMGGAAAIIGKFTDVQGRIMCPIEDISPIPLNESAELLKENEFIVEKDYKDDINRTVSMVLTRVLKPCKHLMTQVKIEIILTLVPTDAPYAYVSIKGYDKREFYGYLSSIHELQQACEVCGFDLPLSIYESRD